MLSLVTRMFWSGCSALLGGLMSDEIRHMSFIDPKCRLLKQCVAVPIWGVSWCWYSLCYWGRSNPAWQRTFSLDFLHVSTLYSMQKEPLVFVIRNVLVGVRLIIDSWSGLRNKNGDENRQCWDGHAQMSDSQEEGHKRRIWTRVRTEGTRKGDQAIYANVSLDPWTRSMYSFTKRVSIAFLMPGSFGANRWEIWEMTSWIKAWFLIVFLAFIILHDRALWDFQ